ncbi:MAG: hypothetical protein IJH90_03400 [Mogibacterium sp.]|nr:hypothetical protein [Mogibacterium sp.]
MKRLKIGLAMVLSAAVLLTACTDGLASAANLMPVDSEYAVATIDGAEVTLCRSESEAVDVLRDCMRERDPSVNLFLLTDTTEHDECKEMMHRLVFDALEHTGQPAEGDYLDYQLDKWYVSWETNSFKGSPGLLISYDINFYSSADQEKQVDDKVREIIDSLDLDGLGTEEKIRRIYDYVCSNVVYDDEHFGDEEYTLMRTAYAALIEGKANCQGYSVALYRLLLEAGIDNRVICGKAAQPGEPEDKHVWNIVCLDGLYYGLDATWDTSGMSREYYLRTGSYFDREHKRSEEFLTDDFMQKYPSA